MYPKAERSNLNAWTYGRLEAPVALVYHTTETPSWASFRLGATAPHYEYNPRLREWRWHGADLTQRVGTMKSSRYTGVPANEKSIQVEIDCYSNKEIADQSTKRLWVGDFTDDNYSDLADFYAWVCEAGLATFDVYAAPTGGWRYDNAQRLRMVDYVWENFTGLTAHGAVPGQQHWDTGVLDLQRIHDEAKGIMATPKYKAPSDYAKPSWAKASAAGVVTVHSNPHAPITYQQLVVLLDRAGLL